MDGCRSRPWWLLAIAVAGATAIATGGAIATADRGATGWAGQGGGARTSIGAPVTQAAVLPVRLQDGPGATIRAAEERSPVGAASTLALVASALALASCQAGRGRARATSAPPPLTRSVGLRGPPALRFA